MIHTRGAGTTAINKRGGLWGGTGWDYTRNALQNAGNIKSAMVTLIAALTTFISLTKLKREIKLGQRE